MERLYEYTEEIAKKEQNILRQEQFLEDGKEKVKRLEAEFQKEAANDDDLTNRNKRKAYIQEQKNSRDEYKQAKSNVQSRSDKLARLKIELNKLENQFTVAKIGARRKNAQIEAGVDTVL